MIGPPIVPPASCRRSSGLSSPARLKKKSLAMSASFW
jgi:hypothetical protein